MPEMEGYKWKVIDGEVFQVISDRWDSSVPGNQIILDSLVGVLPAV